jgi:hypothetical protein
MPTDFGGTYTTGLVTVTNGSPVVSGSGVIWSDFADGLDMFMCNGLCMLVEAVNETYDEITLLEPWEGDSASDQSYVLLKSSPLRYEPALTQAKVRELLLQLDNAGIIYYVSGDEPDPQIGENGQYALKTDALPWTLWLKIADEWVLQDQWTAFNPRGAWSGATTYAQGDLVQHGGYIFVSNDNGNLNHEPDITPSGTSDAFWTWFPLPDTATVLTALGITGVTISEDAPSGGVDGELWFRVDPA